MKYSKMWLVAILFLSASIEKVFAAEETKNEEKESTVIVVTIDPEDEELNENLSENGLVAAQPKNLKELLELLDERPPLSKKHERVEKQTESQQINFLEELEAFVAEPFDKNDPDAEEGFVNQRERIVKLVFGATTERAYFQRLYLLNKIWLDHQEEFERFNSLDLALRDSWLQIEENRRRIQRIVVGVTTLGGLVVGGYLSYQASTKILPMAATQGAIGSVLKWAGRSSIIVVGAWVGGQAGAYLGFLGSDYLISGHFDFVDPIDGDEELRDILDIIEGL